MSKNMRYCNDHSETCECYGCAVAAYEAGDTDRWSHIVAAHKSGCDASLPGPWDKSASQWYEIEGGGPDCVVFADSAESAARVVCEKQAECEVDLEWLDSGSTPQSVARFEWRGNGMVGRCVVSLVSDKMRAILDEAELESDVAYEATEFRSES